MTTPIGARPATPSGRPGGTDAELVGSDGTLTEAGQRQYAAQELGVRAADVMIEGDQARLTDEARRDRIQHAVAADNENIYPGEVRVDTFRDSGRLASERPVTGDEVSQEQLEYTDISLSTSAENRIIKDQVSEAEGVDPDRVQIDREGGEPQLSIEGRGGGESSEQFGDFDWSMGLGGPGDEVENAVDSVPGRVGDFARPKAEKLFSEDVAGESAGHWALSGLGFEQRADQYDSLIRGAGVGVSAGVAEDVTSLPAGGLEAVELFHDVRKNPETATEIPGATADVASESYEMAKENPGETIGALVGAYALGGAPGAGRVTRAAGRTGRTAKSTGGSAVRKSIDRIESGDVLNTGRTDRGQLDLTPPSRSGSSSRSKSGDSGSDSGSSTTITGDDLSGIAARSDPTRGGRYPSGTSGRANVDRGVVRSRDTGDTPSGGASTSLGYRTASSELDTAAKVPTSATQTATQTAVQTDRLGLVSGPLSRARAAATPGWMAGGLLPRGDENTGQTDTVGVTGSLLGEQSRVGLFSGQDMEVDTGSLLDDAQASSVTTDTDSIAGTSEETATVPGQDTGTTPAQDTETTTDTAVIPGTFQPFPEPTHPGQPGPPTTPSGPPRPPRSRRPEGPDLSFDGLDFGGPSNSEQKSPGREADLQPGWLAETVTDIGTLGMEMPGTPSQGQLEDVSGGLGSMADLPTSQLIDGDADVEAAAGMFEFDGFGIDGGESDDSAESGLGFGIDGGGSDDSAESGLGFGVSDESDELDLNLQL